MEKGQSQKNYCCCGLFHKHTLAFVAGTFLCISYGAAFARRVYTATHAPSSMDGIAITAAAIGFIAHVLMVVGNRHHSKHWYIPSLIFNVIWSLDQTRAAIFHSAFIVSVLQHAEAYYKAAAIPVSFEKFLTLVIMDLLFTVVGVLVAFAFFGVIFCGYRYLSREEQSEKLVNISAPTFETAGPLPDKLPITEFA